MSLPLYFDQNVDQAIVEGLRARGIDVLTAKEDGMAVAADELVFRRATSLGRVVVSNDNDFLRIAHRWQADGTYFAGLIHATQFAVSIGDVIEDVEIIAKVKAPHEMANKIEYVPYARLSTR
jgi:hypothetical protein